MTVFHNISVTILCARMTVSLFILEFLSLVIMNNIWWQCEHTVCSEQWHFRRRSSAQFGRVLLTRMHTFGHITVKKWKPHHILGHLTVWLIMVLAVKVAFWDMMPCNQVHTHWHFGGMCYFHLHRELIQPWRFRYYFPLRIWCRSLKMLIFTSSESYPAYMCALPELITGRGRGAMYIWMRAIQKVRFPIFFPAEMITALSWQAWVLVVYMFTTI